MAERGEHGQVLVGSGIMAEGIRHNVDGNG